jgi:trk system potassium uptake protein
VSSPPAALTADPSDAGGPALSGGLAWLRERLDDLARRSPARLTLAVFAGVVLLFSGLLSLPPATASGTRAPYVDALFTATSAVCVTGLVTVNTAEYWSTFGEVVILVAIKIGGLGVLTLASVLGLAVSRRLGLRQRLLAATETKAQRLGEVGSLVRAVVVLSLAVEASLAVVLVPRFWRLGEGWGEGLYHGIFYAVSAFNNAGFVSHPDGMLEYVADPWLSLPVALGVFVGALGFPVLLTLSRQGRRPSDWDLHARMTVAMSVGLLLFSAVAIALFEWSNPRTLGGLDGGARLLAVTFAAVMPRSGGFSTLEVGDMRETTWLLQDALMFVGGGSASTAGGIKVTTLAVLLLAVVAEARGDDDVNVSSRRLAPATLRLAVTVLLVGGTVVTIATLGLLALTGLPLDIVLFEVISAFATCGLSTGVTPELPESGKYLLSALMYVGRTGTMTMAAALALRERRRLFRLPEERPIVG